MCTCARVKLLHITSIQTLKGWSMSAAQYMSSLHSPIRHIHTATMQTGTLHLSHMHVLCCMCAHWPLRLRMKSSRPILRWGLMLGEYMSVLRRTTAKARMKMVSGLWNCCTTSGLHIQYLWLRRRNTTIELYVWASISYQPYWSGFEATVPLWKLREEATSSISSIECDQCYSNTLQRIKDSTCLVNNSKQAQWILAYMKS